MAISRQVFDVNRYDTGTWCDTGPPSTGTIRQMRWAPTGGDTGTCDLEILAIPVPGDTGSGIVVARETLASGVVANGFTRYYTQDLQTLAGAADTGAILPVVAGELLRVKVTPTGALTKGKLFIYIEND